MIDPKITQQAIDKLVNSKECMDSIRGLKCYDYEARFGAFIRVKHGNIVINLVDWPKVATVVNSHV